MTPISPTPPQPHRKSLEKTFSREGAWPWHLHQPRQEICWNQGTAPPTGLIDLVNTQGFLDYQQCPVLVGTRGHAPGLSFLLCLASLALFSHKQLSVLGS